MAPSAPKVLPVENPNKQTNGAPRSSSPPRPHLTLGRRLAAFTQERMGMGLHSSRGAAAVERASERDKQAEADGQTDRHTFYPTHFSSLCSFLPFQDDFVDDGRSVSPIQSKRAPIPLPSFLPPLVSLLFCLQRRKRGGGRGGGVRNMYSTVHRTRSDLLRRRRHRRRHRPTSRLARFLALLSPPPASPSLRPSLAAFFSSFLLPLSTAHFPFVSRGRSSSALLGSTLLPVSRSLPCSACPVPTRIARGPSRARKASRRPRARPPAPPRERRAGDVQRWALGYDASWRDIEVPWDQFLQLKVPSAQHLWMGCKFKTTPRPWIRWE